MPEGEANILIGNEVSEPVAKSFGKSLSFKLTFWFLVLAIVPMILIASMSYYQAYSSLRQAAVDELVQAADLNERFIRSWFNYRFTDVTLQAGVPTHKDLLISLREGYEHSNTDLFTYVHSSDWQARVKGQEDSIVAIGAAYPYVYDIFLIDNQGNILYTIEHEDDFGTNLFDGRYAQTKFSWLVQ